MRNATKHRLTTSWMDVDGNTYEARVYVEVTAYSGQPEDVYASAEPATIEWQRGEPLDPVQGSSLTLRIMSDNDRQFADLYSAQPFGARVEVDRNGMPYWSGTLDPETYGEPYTAELGYVVELTFADFGPLERVDWSATGVMSIADIVDTCIDAAQLRENTQIDIRTTTEGYSDGANFTPIDMHDVLVDCADFYDEEGEPMTMRQVLEGVLQPFGLKAVQRDGAIRIWDINTMCAMEPTLVRWSSTDQRLQAAKTFNNVEVTFSPYSASGIADCDTDDINKGYSGGVAYKTSYDWANAAEGFNFIPCVPTAASNLPYEVSDALRSGHHIAQPFAIRSEFSGSDCGGVAAYFKGWQQNGYDVAQMPMTAMDLGNALSNIPGSSARFGGQNNSQWIIRKRGLAVPASTQGVCLSLKLDMLFDSRYNPFEPSNVNNEEGNFGRMSRIRMACVPCRVIWRGANKTMHVDNYGVVTGRDPASAHPATWANGEGSLGDCLLAYYEASNYMEGNALGGWKTNRHAISAYRPDVSEKLQKMHEGQLIEIPGPGTIDIEIGTGIYIPASYDYPTWAMGPLPYEEMRWLLYGDLKLEVVKENGNDLRSEDVVDRAWITRGAKETLSIDTICGTVPNAINNPCARGALLKRNIANGVESVRPWQTFGRSGNNDRIERLLIGTAFSQYAGRKTELTGTAKITTGWGPRSDQATEGKFLILGETQDLKQNETELDMVQISPDDYEGVTFIG